MKTFSLSRREWLAACGGFALAEPSLAAESPAAKPPVIVIVRDVSERIDPIPISLSGFTGEVDSALRFDLTVMGFEVTGPENARFSVKGANSGSVQGQLNDAVAKQAIFAKAYSGGSLRTQAHALADDIVFAVTGAKGIAQTKIAFKNDTGVASEIFVADFDGFNGVAVTADKNIVAAPTWVPGRRVLYYTSYKLNNPDIFRHDVVTGDRAVIARYSGTNTSAAVSPDGSKVAMVLSKSGAPNIWVANADGSGLKQLTSNREGDSSPCWSPDGQTICFSSRASGRSALYTVSAAGGPMRRLPTTGVPNPTEPDWSPDGKFITFTAQAGGFDICVIPSRGGNATVLAAGEDPSWAPNSRNIIFARRTGGKRVLSLLDVPTRRVKDLQRISGSCSQPSWAK
jgi:TolB protein